MKQDLTTQELLEDLYYTIKELAIQESAEFCETAVQNTLQQVRAVRPMFDWKVSE
jgi:hypothetical protein